jgi:hypothetical protein
MPKRKLDPLPSAAFHILLALAGEDLHGYAIMWMLKLYPARFRQKYEVPAMQLFRDRLRAERSFPEGCGSGWM